MIDLHCHSLFSDGSFSPAALLAMAEEMHLEVFSITDHNSVGAYADLADPAIRKGFSGKLITGIELTSIIDGQQIEILGYGIDPEQISPIVQKVLARNTHDRLLQLLYGEYTARGVCLPRPMEEYSVEKHRNPRRFVFDQLVSEPENHAFFLDFRNHTDAPLTYYRQELYNEKSPLYIDCSPLYLPMDAIIAAIHNAGGLAFLAHSYCYTDAVYDHLDDITDRYSLDGLECFYPRFTREQTDTITALCQRKNLLMSGGSDFHGELRPDISLGIGAGNLCIPGDIAPWVNAYLF